MRGRRRLQRRSLHLRRRRSEVKVFDPSHTLLTSIANANEPCGLAVNGKGELFVSERASGKVVRYKPNAYPFAGTPTYGAAEPIDESGAAKGISVDPHDDRLYVAEGDHIAAYEADGSFEANLGEGDLVAATGIAAYTYTYNVQKNFEGKVVSEDGTRYLSVADPAGAEPDTVKILSGTSHWEPGATSFGPIKLRKTIASVDQDRNPETPEQSLGFGSAGAYLGVDPGNGDAAGKCDSVAEQACTAGHLLVYDQSHQVVDEFDAAGHFLDQLSGPAIADAEPTAMALDRSGGSGDGTIYATTGAAAGAKALAFGPLAAPSRPPRRSSHRSSPAPRRWRLMTAATSTSPLAR